MAISGLKILEDLPKRQRPKPKKTAVYMSPEMWELLVLTKRHFKREGMTINKIIVDALNQVFTKPGVKEQILRWRNEEPK
jgi:hypothetical protein